MPANSGNTSGFHTGKAAADNSNLFADGSLAQIVAVLKENGGVDGAHGHAAVKQRCSAVMTANAGTNGFGPPHEKLLRVVRLCQRGAAEHYAVNPALSQGLFTEIGIVHFTGKKYGDGHSLFYCLCQTEVIAVVHVIRRIGIIESVIASGITVEHVHTIFLKFFDYFNGLLE